MTTTPQIKKEHSNSRVLAAIVFVAGYLLDLGTKQWVLATMFEGEKIPVVPPLLHWHFIKNPGAAFSIGTDYTWLFTLIQALALIWVSYLLLRRVRVKSWYITLSALAAGIAGNLTDRLFREPGFGVGHVIDFIALPNFAIFNIADMLIVCSMIVVVLLVFKGVTLDGQPERS